MSVVDLLEHWAAQGVEFGVDAGDVVFDAPADVDLDQLGDAIRACKAAVVAHLQGRDGRSPNDAAGTTTAVAEPVRHDAAVATGQDQIERPAEVGVYADESEGLGSWDDESAVLWTAESKHCPRCRSAAIWTSFTNKTFCTVCSPPERSRQILETAEQFRRRLGIAPPLSAVLLANAMRGRRHWRPKREAATDLPRRKPR